MCCGYRVQKVSLYLMVLCCIKTTNKCEESRHAWSLKSVALFHASIDILEKHIFSYITFYINGNDSN